MFLEMLRDMDFRSFIICKKYSFVKKHEGGNYADYKRRSI